MAVGNISINAVINVNYETESSRIAHSLRMRMKQLMIKSLTVTSCLIILILFVIQVAKNKAPEYFPGDSQDSQNMDGLDRFNYIMHNQKQHHAFPNQNLRILHPIINTCILECGNDPDHRLCQSCDEDTNEAFKRYIMNETFTWPSIAPIVSKNTTGMKSLPRDDGIIRCRLKENEFCNKNYRHIAVMDSAIMES